MDFKWDRSNIEKLIVSVQEESCIYNIRCIEYVDRTKKAKSFNKIYDQLKEQMPGLTVEEVKKKWTNLRSQYGRELRLIKNSKKSGSGRNELHKPKLWCFEQLSFLETHSATRQSADNIETDDNSASTSTEVTSEELAPKQPKNKYAAMRNEFTSFKERINSKKCDNSASTSTGATSGELAPKQPKNKYAAMRNEFTSFKDRINSKKCTLKYKLVRLFNSQSNGGCSSGITGRCSIRTANGAA